MKPGNKVWVWVHKADGRPYRRWQARVETVRDDGVVTYTNHGNRVYQVIPDSLSGAPAWREFTQPRAIRNHYWFDRQHTLLEVYNPDGSLYELYADVCSPVRVVDGELHYTDHELDVSQLAGEAPQIIDQDEFAEAAEEFGYSEAFQAQCYAIAEELLAFVAAWVPAGAESNSTRINTNLMD